jgi:Tfp pilus assembly protein PilO
MYIAIALVLVISLAAVFLLILPNFQKATELDSQIQTEQTNLTTAQALVARRQSAKAQSAANEVDLMRIANQMPDSPQLPSVIIELQDVANAAGVELPTLNVGDVAAAAALADGTVPVYQVLPLTLTCQGTWAEVIDFTRRLNGLERGVRVKTTNFTYVPKTPEKDAYIQASVSLEVYVMAAAETGASPTAIATGQ